MFLSDILKEGLRERNPDIEEKELDFEAKEQERSYDGREIAVYANRKNDWKREARAR